MNQKTATKTTNRTIRAGWTAALLLSLAACGGGGGNDDPAPAPQTPQQPQQPEQPTRPRSTLSGVAATGAPFALAAISVTDATGTELCPGTTTDAKGFYACTLPETAKAPLVVRATRDDQVFYSTTASVDSGTANVTPLTTIVVAQLSPDGNPASLAGAIQTNPSSVTSATIQAQVTELLAALQPLLAQMGESIDPITGVFAADGTGQDRVLDTISVSVRPDGTAANIEITVKTVPTNEGAPVSIVYRTSDAGTPVLPPIAPSQLAQTPTPALVAALLDRINACYALPLTQRVQTATSDSVNATGTAADVTAAECRGIFVDDNPATYVVNGASVGRDANGRGAFESLFRFGPTGLKHDRGNFEFFRSNGDMVITYRWTDAVGNTDNDTFAVRNQDGVLKLTGNANTYRAAVRPVSEDRENLNAAAYDAYTTGYNVSIDNRLNGNGTASIFDRVVVTTPWETQLTYKPRTGLSYLVVVKQVEGQSDELTASSIVRLAAGYKSASTAGNLSEKEPNIYFTAPQSTEAELRILKDQSVWKLEFFLVGSQTPVVQTYRTLSRAQTIDEIRNTKFVELTPAHRAEMTADSAATGRFTFGQPFVPNDPNVVDFSAEGDLDAWLVPAGALAPTSFSAYGRAPFGSTTSGVQGDRFNDSVTLRSTARKAYVTCSPLGTADKHCVTQTPGSPPYEYANGSYVNSFDLWVRNARQVELKKTMTVYPL